MPITIGKALAVAGASGRAAITASAGKAALFLLEPQLLHVQQLVRLLSLPVELLLPELLETSIC